MQCELCGEESEMEFNYHILQIGMFKGMLCLDCWGSFPGDTEIVGALLAKREEQVMGLFGVTHETILDASKEVQAQVTEFLLRGNQEEKDASINTA